MSGAFAVGVAIELNAVHSQIKANQPEGLKSRHPQNKDPKRFFYREFFSDEEPGKEWKQYEISFVPDKTGSIVLGLSSTYFRERDIVYWIDYDKLEFINATGFVNPSFEELSYKKEFFHWRYYTKQSEKLNQNDAPDGKNYARVSRSYPIRQTIAVKAGQKVTIKFMARSAGSTARPADPKFRSDTAAGKTAPSKAAVASAKAEAARARFSGDTLARVVFRAWPYQDTKMQIKSVKGDFHFIQQMVKGKPSPYNLDAFSKKPLTSKWQKGELSFIPDTSGEVQMWLESVAYSRGKTSRRIYFDKIEATGATVLNPSFEKVQASTFARWACNPGNVRKVADAVDGNYVAAVNYHHSMRQVLTVVKDRPVTIRFYCRLGDVAEEKQFEFPPKKIKNDYPAKYYRFYDKKTAKYLPLENKGVPGSAIPERYPWQKLNTPPALTIAYPVAQKAGKLGKTSVAFELLEESGIARSVEIKHGFPFPKGGIYGVDKLAVVSPAGKAVPAQFTAISFWPDKSVKFVLVRFRADLKANEKSNWKLEINSARTIPSAGKLLCRETADGFAVDTGRLTAKISKNKFNFLSDIKVDGKAAGSFAPNGLELVDEHKKRFTSAAVPLKKLYVESKGKLALTLRADGELADTKGRYTVRMTFHAGSPVVDFSIRYHNVSLKNEFHDFRSLNVSFVPAQKADVLTMDGVAAERIHQIDDTMLRIGNRYFNRMICDGGSAANISYALKDAAKRYPKAFSVKDGKLNFELLPELPGEDFGKDMPFYLQYPFCGGCYRMKWGMGFTEDLVIDFSGKTKPEELAAKSVVPVIDVTWVHNSKVFPGVPAKWNNPFSGLDAKMLEAFYRHMKTKAQQREYGFMNWGDWYGERGRNWTNNEYDMPHGLFMLYLRTGNRDAFRWAMTGARHQADVDIIHAYPDPLYVGANAQHGIGHTGQSSSNPTPAVWSKPYDGSYRGTNGHTWSEGMTEAWLLGGDEITMESALLLGEHLITYVAPMLDRLSTHERSAGWSIPAILGIYRATGDKKYLDAARMLVELILDEQKFDLGGAWPHRLPSDHAGGHKKTFGNCPYLVGIVLNALQKFYEEEPCEKVKKSIVSGAGWLHNGFSRSRVGWPYGMAYDGFHYWLAGQGLNLIIAPGMMTGGRLSDNQKIYEDTLLVTSCSTMTGVSHVGKSLSITLCMLPTLFEEMNRYSAKHPEAGKYQFMSTELAKHLNSGMNTRFRMRGPDNMAFEVIARKPGEITISRYPTGSHPNPRPEFSAKVIDKSGKVIKTITGKIRAKGEWKVALPAKGRYMVEIVDSCTGVWDVAGKDCRVRTQLRKGYQFVNSGLSRQLIIIPAGTKEFTLEFFGTHEGGCSAFLMDPRGRIVGNELVTTTGKPRLPWFKFDPTQPVGKIKVKIDKPYKRESAWKLIVFAGGDVRMDLIGADAQVALSRK